MKIELPAGGNVIGLGSDIVDVDRIRSAHERHKDRFLNRIFTEEEKEYCLAMSNPYPHLAARFAAKEAISKAFTTGIGTSLGWKAMSIYKGEREQPLVRLDEQGQSMLTAVGGKDVLVTLSHTATVGHAVALIIQ